MIGLALLGVGAVLLWAAFTKRGDAVLSALNIDLPAAGADPAKTAGDAASTSSGGSSNQTASSDSGSHAGIDANGNLITIDKAYGDMSAEEKDAANRFAHQLDQLGSIA